MQRGEEMEMRAHVGRAMGSQSNGGPSACRQRPGWHSNGIRARLPRQHQAAGCLVTGLKFEVPPDLWHSSLPSERHFTFIHSFTSHLFL